MKIVDLRTTVLESRYDRAIAFAHMDLSRRQIVLLEILTDEGLVGLGDIDGPPAGDMAALTIVESTFKPLLVGENPLRIGALHDRMFEVLHRLGRYQSLESYVLGAVDVALWDILGKATGRPIADLLGRRRSEVGAYASLGRLPEDEVRDEVARYSDAGFAGVKIRIGFPGESGEGLVARARSELGEGSACRLMADVNSGWSRAEAFRNARALECYNLTWIEEPLMPWDLAGSAELANALDTPVALGEHEIFNRFDAERILQIRAADIVQPDLRQGLSECHRIAVLAGARNIPCVPHFFGPAIRFSAMLQLLGSIENYMLCEYPVAFDPIRFELTDPPMLAENGKVSIPEGPGLGITLVPATIARYRA